MYIQDWILEAKVRGNFYLVDRRNIKSQNPLHPSIRELRIDPEFDKNDKQTGEFNIHIEFTLKSDEERLDPVIPADMGRNLLNSYMDLLAFLSNSPVYLVSQPVLTYKYPGTNKYRKIIFPSQTATVTPPVPITDTSIFNIDIDPKIGRILSLLKVEFQEKDKINSLADLYIALDILSNQFECKEKITRTCTKCGEHSELKPSLKQKVENLLINIVGYSEEKCKKIWNTRHKIIHGGIESSAENLRLLPRIVIDLRIAIIKGIKKNLNLGTESLPIEDLLGISFSDAFVDVDYTLPEKK